MKFEVGQGNFKVLIYSTEYTNIQKEEYVTDFWRQYKTLRFCESLKPYFRLQNQARVFKFF